MLFEKISPKFENDGKEKEDKRDGGTTVLAKDGGSFVLMRQPRRWKEVGRIKIFRQKGP